MGVFCASTLAAPEEEGEGAAGFADASDEVAEEGEEAEAEGAEGADEAGEGFSFSAWLARSWASSLMLFDLLIASLRKTSVPFPSVTNNITPHTIARVIKEEIIDTATTFFFVFLLSFLKVLTGAFDLWGTTAEEPETVLLAGFEGGAPLEAPLGGKLRGKLA